MTFLDTNVLVYAVDPRDDKKHAAAGEIVGKAMCSPEFGVSAQVLFEFSNVCLEKLKLSVEQVLIFLGDFSKIQCVFQSPELVRRTVEVKALYGISLPDSMIAAAAEKAGCDELLTEDLNDRQTNAGVRVRNPFR